MNSFFMHTDTSCYKDILNEPMQKYWKRKEKLYMKPDIIWSIKMSNANNTLCEITKIAVHSGSVLLMKRMQADDVQTCMPHIHIQTND